MLLPLPFGHALDQVALFKASQPFYRAALLQGLNTGTSKRLKGLQYKKQVAKYKPNQQCSLYLNPSCCKCTTYKAAQGCNLFSPQQKPVLHFVKPTLFARFSFLCFYSKLALFQGFSLNPFSGIFCFLDSLETQCSLKEPILCCFHGKFGAFLGQSLQLPQAILHSLLLACGLGS